MSTFLNEVKKCSKDTYEHDSCSRMYTSIATKIGKLTSALVAALLTVIGIVSFYFYNKVATSYYGDMAEASASSIASFIDGDAFESALQSDSLTYLSHLNDNLSQTIQNSGLERVYLVSQNNDLFQYVIIASTEDYQAALSEFLPDGYSDFISLAFNSGLGTRSGFIIDPVNSANGYIMSGFSPILNSNGEIVGVVGTDSDAELVVYKIKRYIVVIVIVVTVFALIFALTARWFINRTLGKPIKDLAELSSDVSAGKLDVNVRVKTKDEIAYLTQSFLSIINTLRSLSASIKDAYIAQTEGKTGLLIDSSQYEGVFREITENFNSITSSSNLDIADILSCVQSMCNGHFDAQLRQFPGEKSEANRIIDGMRSNLLNVSGTIFRLISSTVEGELKVRADVSMFNGDWKKMVAGVNNLLDSVLDPIDEIDTLLLELEKARFDVQVEGDYKGEFKLMKDTLNKTVRSIALYINDISDALNKMAQDDYRRSINLEYIGGFALIKDSLNKILERLNSVLSEINNTADEIKISSEKITLSSSKLDDGAKQQASTLEQLANDISVISDKATQNGEIAEKANDLSSSATQNALSVNDEMKEMLSAMNDINESSTNISKIIKIIEDIAFQTNLLALNAAVEAARAGEHGKGFAVVAEEVRSLASRSQEAAQNTTSLISGSFEKVAKGTKVANTTAIALNEIVDQIKEISDYTKVISSSSNEQSSSLSKINDRIILLTTLTQTNMDISQENSMLAEGLLERSESFKNMAGKFNLKS